MTATAPCTGLTASTDYELTVYYDRHDSGDDSFIDTISDVIAFTAADTTEDIEIEVPIVDGFKYTIQTGTAAIAAA